MFFGARNAYINDGGWRGWEKGRGESVGCGVVVFGRMCGRFCGGVGRDCGMSCTVGFLISGWKAGCVREDFVLFCGQSM